MRAPSSLIGGSHYELRYKTIDKDINPFLFFALAEQHVGLDGLQEVDIFDFNYDAGY
jgi:hypothetical protein